MARHVQNFKFTIGATSVQVLAPRTAGLRVSWYLTNVSAAAEATIAKGETAAVADAGVVLQPNSTMFEASGDRLHCWQGAVQVVGSGAGEVGISEEWEDDPR